MIINLPQAPGGNPVWAHILDTIRRAFGPVVSQDEAAARILLRSPNGTIYSLTVDDAGTPATVVIDGKTRP